MISQCNSGWPGTHRVDQTGLEITEAHLPLPSQKSELVARKRLSDGGASRRF